MEVINHSQRRLRTVDVSVITWTFLPVSKRFHSRSLVDGKSLEQAALRLFQQLFDSKRKWPFNRLEKLVDSSGVLAGEDEQMNVLGHVDEGR
jgi:hypothetical protein